MDRSPAALLRDPDARRAAALAAAVMGGNFVALGFTVVFARMFGGPRYGSLAALLSTFTILMVPGAALQTTVAREISAALASGDPAAGAALGRWMRRLALLTVAVTLVSVAARRPIADLIGVRDLPWAAAAALPAGALWLILSVLRGALQAFQRYRIVGISVVAEQLARLALALMLAAAGLGVTGAYLGTPLALLLIALALALPLRRQLAGGTHRPASPQRLRDLFRRAAWPVTALALIAWLQDGHVIIVKHIASSGAAGAWGAAGVAAKAIMWVAAGLALWVVPEAARRAKIGLDPRGVLAVALAIIGALATAMVLVYAVGARQLLHVVFKFSSSAGALPWLGLAMSMLAFSYLASQYQLALHRIRFIGVLLAAAIVQPLALVAIGPDLTALALGLFALQATVAAVLLALALRPADRPAVAADYAEDAQATAALTQA